MTTTNLSSGFAQFKLSEPKIDSMLNDSETLWEGKICVGRSRLRT